MMLHNGLSEVLKMSEVKRISVFMHGPNKKVDMVEASHLDSAQSELAALREELAESGRADHLRQRIAFLTTEIHARASERDDLQQRLTAAEQRNAEWQLLLEECIDSGQVDGILAEDIQNALALIKPTGSGASGSTCNQIREESGLPINKPCIACNNGACIDK
jgi:septal ring factor EnvC (AmiA/AmiB activator)